jgi:hypothetical protein
LTSIIVPEKPNLTHTLCFMFSGKAGCGKSFSADLAQKLCNDLGLKTYRAPFAKGVKATANYMGWDGNKDTKGRILLQKIGFIGREYDKDMWVRSAMKDIEESVGYPYDAVFIDDWRFKNEYDYIFKNELMYKPIPIRIEAPSREILKGTPEYTDLSETELDDFDFPYTNYVCNDPDYLFYRDCLGDIIYREIIKCTH